MTMTMTMAMKKKEYFLEREREIEIKRSYLSLSAARIDDDGYGAERGLIGGSLMTNDDTSLQ